MTPSRLPQRDLIVLAADLDMKVSTEALLGNPRILGIRQIQFDVLTHNYRDPGCRTGAASCLANFTNRYHYAIVIFDRDGCGSTAPRDQIQREVEQALHHNGWPDRARAIVIQPELEAWIWTSSPVTATTLGCGSLTELRVPDLGHGFLNPLDRRPFRLRAIHRPCGGWSPGRLSGSG